MYPCMNVSLVSFSLHLFTSEPEPFFNHYTIQLSIIYPKNRTYSKFKPPQISDPLIKANWDPTKSASVNLQNLGLSSAPNADVNSRGQKVQNASPKDGTSFPTIELYDIPESDSQKQKWTNMPMSEDNQKYIIRCFEKYGDDYKKMSRDIKLNDMQHTENKLRKMGARFLLLSESQRKVDIPENIQHLVTTS